MHTQANGAMTNEKYPTIHANEPPPKPACSANAKRCVPLSRPPREQGLCRVATSFCHQCLFLHLQELPPPTRYNRSSVWREEPCLLRTSPRFLSAWCPRRVHTAFGYPGL